MVLLTVAECILWQVRGCPEAKTLHFCLDNLDRRVVPALEATPPVSRQAKACRSLFLPLVLAVCTTSTVVGHTLDLSQSVDTIRPAGIVGVVHPVLVLTLAGHTLQRLSRPP